MASNSNLYKFPYKPIDYSLRVSRRTRHAKLQIKPYGGLEVVIPTRFPRQAVPGLVIQHDDWIRRQLQAQEARIPASDLPEEIFLAINRSRRTVVYRPTTRYLDDGLGLLTIGDRDYDQSVKQLRQWIRDEAWKTFPPMLESLSRRTGLDYKKISIRSQKTRWGSCSSRGTISLNDQLLFVDRDTVEYLMIHELCHRRYMNHSARFWRLVECHCADFRFHESALNLAKAEIPGWILRDLYS